MTQLEIFKFIEYNELECKRDNQKEFIVLLLPIQLIQFEKAFQSYLDTIETPLELQWIGRFIIINVIDILEYNNINPDDLYEYIETNI